MASTIIIARHGRTAWNVEGRIQGHRGDELDSIGKSQSQTLGQHLLRRFPTLNRVITSDLLRAEQTGRIIANIFRVPLRSSDRRLRECAFGSLEGLTHEEILANFGQRLHQHLRDRTFPYDFREFGGECRTEVVERQQECLESLLAGSNGAPILVIGHGRSLNSLLQACFSHIEVIERNCEYRVIDL